MHAVTSADLGEQRNPWGKKGTQWGSGLLMLEEGGTGIHFGPGLGGVRVLAQMEPDRRLLQFSRHCYLKSFEASLSMSSYLFCIVL